MAGPDRDRPSRLVDAIKTVFDTKPEGEGGIGPTLGQDLTGQDLGGQDLGGQDLGGGAPGRAGAGDATPSTPPALSAAGGGAGAAPAAGHQRLGVAEAGIDLDDSVLRSTDVGGAGRAGGTGPTAGDIGGANAAGFGASLGSSANTTDLSSTLGADRSSANEQQDARKAQGLAETQAATSDRGEAPAGAADQTRGGDSFGSINQTQGE